MDDHFRVTLRSEDVSFPLELVAQFSIVVYLAVEHEPKGLVFIGDWLVTR
jgi:hypothetical protein